MGDHVKPHVRWMEGKDSIAAFEHMWEFPEISGACLGGVPDSECYIVRVFTLGVPLI